MIRKFIKQDRDELLNILNKLEAQGIFKKEEVACAMELVDIFLDEPAQKDYKCISCIKENKLLGYACYGKVPLTDAVYDLYWIAVDPDLQGKGYGKLLMKYVEEKLKNKNVRKIFVETSSLPIYDDTRKFYLTLEYKEVSKINDFYSKGDHRIIFEKVLL